MNDQRTMDRNRLSEDILRDNRVLKIEDDRVTMIEPGAAFI